MSFVPARIAVGGLGAVGKTTLCRAIMNEPTDIGRIETAGLQYHNWAFPDNSGSAIFFDFGGQEMWDSILRRTIARLSGLLSAKLILLVFDVSTLQNFNESVRDLHRWIDYFEEAGKGSNIVRPVLFVGNKIDAEKPERIENGGMDASVRNTQRALMEIIDRIASPNQTQTLKLLYNGNTPRERFEKNVKWISALYYNRNPDYQERIEELRQAIIYAAKMENK